MLQNKNNESNNENNQKGKKPVTKKERTVLILSVFIFLGALISWSFYYYFKSTEKVADFGGEFIEGYVGKILYINPVLSQSNEIDTLLSNLIFSSLFKYNNQAKITEDLVEKYEIIDNGKTYKIKLREDVKWQDGTSLTAKDIAFTIDLIKNPAFRSSLRGFFETNGEEIQINVKDDYNLEFILKEPSGSFLNKLTFGILPKHVLSDVSAENFLLNEFNVKPIGSGPYAFYNLEKDSQDNIISYQLIVNENYYQKKPYLDKLIFNFYSSEDEMIEAYKNKEINGFGISSYDKISQFQNKNDAQMLKIIVPRYFAIFFNEKKSIPLADKDVRKALNLATNKDDIIEKVFLGYAEKINGPILDNFGDIRIDITESQFNIDEANKILEEAGWKKEEDSNIRKKDDELLKVNITTTQWPALEQTAEIIKNQWQEVGVEVEITKVGINEFQQNYIRPRDYEAILFGQEYNGNSPDPYIFWHSSNKKDPGKNIAVYENEEIDKILEEIKGNNNEEKSKELYQEFINKLNEDYPAVFLFSPYYVYIANNKIKGIELNSIINPALHLNDILNWHINTKRIKKQTK